MKISKLFHWLYAFLMFLPVLALAPSLFYFAFNQQSQNYTDVQVNETYEYETNEVNSVDDLVEGNIYKINGNFSTLDGIEGNTIEFNIIYNPNVNSYLTISSYQNLYNDTYTYYNYNYISIYDDYIEIYFGDLIGISTNDNMTFTNYYLVLNSLTNIDIENFTFINSISASDYLGEKNVEVVRSEQSPMNIFYTAVNYVYDMPVFSWVKTSFLALPITYVTGLFGMASTNVVNYYLSYWLAISIVYLVFDLVMYVPLLVHRWIDKGMIE